MVHALLLKLLNFACRMEEKTTHALVHCFRALEMLLGFILPLLLYLAVTADGQKKEAELKQHTWAC